MINRAVTMRQYPDDYPHVRASSYCVGCEGTKEAGLVLCWPCWRALKHASRVEQAAVDNKLDLQEVRLAAHFALQARFAPIESREVVEYGKEF